MDAIEIIITCILIGAIVIPNVIANYIVLHTYFEVKNRRLYQMLFIWLVPFIGAIFAIYTNREDYFEQKYKQKNWEKIGNNPNISESQAIDFAITHDHHGGR